MPIFINFKTWLTAEFFQPCLITILQLSPACFLNATFYFSFPPSCCPSFLPLCLVLSLSFSFSLIPEHHCLKMQQSSIVCCQDHNYGAPPPPTPPASPLSQTIIPRMELNGSLGRPRPRFHTNDPDNSADSDSSSEEEGAVPSGWCQCRLTSDRYLIKCESCR